jgi:tetratricopeptide (TPR) repeat protein
MADELGLDEIRAHALGTVGMAKIDLDDPTGIEDMESALELAVSIESPVASTTANNLAVQAALRGDLETAEKYYIEAHRLAQRFGDRSTIRFLRANFLWQDFMRGDWATALAEADAFIAECEAGSPHTNEGLARMVRGSIREARSDLDGALADRLRAVDRARENADTFQLIGALALLSASYCERGEPSQAAAHVNELVTLIKEHGVHGALGPVVTYASELGVTDELRAAVQEAPGPRAMRWRQVILLGLDGDFAAAAAIYAEMGNPTLEARARLDAGALLIEQGDREAGEAELRKALAFYRSVDAAHFVEKAELLLAQGQKESA